jgi:mycoredoxin
VISVGVLRVPIASAGHPIGRVMMSNVVMYGAQWCGDCRRVKAYLEHNSVPFTYVDLEQEPGHIETVIEYNGGRRTIPVVVFPDGTHLTEPSDEDLAAKVASSGIA